MTLRDAAKKAGFNQSAFTRWKGGAKADPEFVVKFARAFNLDVLEALVEAEFITEDEARFKAPPVDAELRSAIRDIEVSGLELAQLASEMYRTAERMNLLSEKDDMLAARRSNNDAGGVRHDSYDGTVVDWDDTIPHAADSSPDETEERLKRGEDPID